MQSVGIIIGVLAAIAFGQLGAAQPTGQQRGVGAPDYVVEVLIGSCPQPKQGHYAPAQAFRNSRWSCRPQLRVCEAQRAPGSLG